MGIKTLRIKKIEDFREIMRIAYIEYTGSYFWQEVRQEVKSRNNSKCVDCGAETENGTCHHVSYKHWGKGNYEEIDDCVWLCKKCHNSRHNRNMDEPPPFWAKRNFDRIIIDEKELHSVCMHEIGV